MSSAIAPWHMWGNSVVVEATQNAALAVVANTVQVAKVAYKRPETWAFWLGARLIGGDAPLVPSSVNVRFSMIVGVGRSHFATEQPGPLVSFNTWFANFRFTIPAGVVPGLQNDNIKYVTAVTSPPMNDAIATSVQTIERLVAEDIQCQAQLYLASLAVGLTVRAEATAFFAPLGGHVRPDWFQADDTRQYLGNEVGGS